MSEIIILQFLQYTQQSCQLGFEGSYLIIMTKETAISFDYRKDACLTMRDFETVILRCILYYNSQRILENFME